MSDWADDKAREWAIDNLNALEPSLAALLREAEAGGDPDYAAEQSRKATLAEVRSVVEAVSNQWAFNSVGQAVLTEILSRLENL
jgi:hypothetical protein